MPCLEVHAGKPRAPIFARHVDGIGRFAFYPLAEDDFALLHRWVTEPRASFWGMQGTSADDVAAVYQAQINSAHCEPFMVYLDGNPAFLLETYDPAHDELGQHYAVAPGDRGMHFLVAPAEGAPIHGFTRAVMDTILAYLFSDPQVERVVVEPDERNEKIHALNRAAGFQYLHTVTLSYKTAWFAVCERPARSTTVKAIDQEITV